MAYYPDIYWNTADRSVGWGQGQMSQFSKFRNFHWFGVLHVFSHAGIEKVKFCLLWREVFIHVYSKRVDKKIFLWSRSNVTTCPVIIARDRGHWKPTGIYIPAFSFNNFLQTYVDEDTATYGFIALVSNVSLVVEVYHPPNSFPIKLQDTQGLKRLLVVFF